MKNAPGRILIPQPSEDFMTPNRRNTAPTP